MSNGNGIKDDRKTIRLNSETNDFLTKLGDLCVKRGVILPNGEPANATSIITFPLDRVSKKEDESEEKLFLFLANIYGIEEYLARSIAKEMSRK